MRRASQSVPESCGGGGAGASEPASTTGCAGAALYALQSAAPVANVRPTVQMLFALGSQYAAVGEQIVILDPDEPDRRRMCADSEAEYLEACLYGSRVVLEPPAQLVKVWDGVR